MRDRDSLPGFHVPKEFQKKGHAQMAKHVDADDVDDDAEADIGHAANDESEEEELNSSPPLLLLLLLPRQRGCGCDFLGWDFFSWRHFIFW